MMSSQIIQDKHLGEQYIRVEHPSGLTMLLYPMPGFSTTYAMFSTQYGSVDTCFRRRRGESRFGCRRASPTTWSTRCLRARTATPSPVRQDRSRRQRLHQL